MADWKGISEQALAANIVAFNLIGNFGNFNLVWCTVRRKELRSISGILLAINAVYQSICLLSLLFNAALIIKGAHISRRSCFSVVTAFSIACSQQAIMAFSIALDLFLAVVYPVRYRLFNTVSYCLASCGFGWIFALFFTIYAWVMMNDDMLEYCNVLIGMPPTVASLWTECNVAINFGVLIIYLLTFLALKCNYNPATSNEHHRVIRSLSIIMIFFVCTWFMALLGSYVFNLLGVSSHVLPHLQMYMTPLTQKSTRRKTNILVGAAYKVTFESSQNRLLKQLEKCWHEFTSLWKYFITLLSFLRGTVNVHLVFFSVAFISASLCHYVALVRQTFSSNAQNTFFALVCYSQNFYICIWRSMEYRRAFVEQLYIMSCRKPKQQQSQLISVSERVQRSSAN